MLKDLLMQRLLQDGERIFGYQAALQGIADALREEILSGTCQADVFPTESDLCKRYAVSRFTVRETLRSATASLEGGINNTQISSGNDIAGLGAIVLHSQALLVTLMWAEDNADSNWAYASRDILSACFPEDIARALPGISGIKGNITSSGYAMRTAIAYSAIDEGERPFGDVAIRAMLDDASDFGEVLRYGALPAWRNGAADAASGRIIVEFTELMVLRDVEAFGSNATDATRPARLGIISNIYTDQGALSAMPISFDDSLWALGGPLHQPAEHETLVNALVDATLTGAELERVARWYSEEEGGDLLETIDEVVFGFPVKEVNDNQVMEALAA